MGGKEYHASLGTGIRAAGLQRKSLAYPTSSTGRGVGSLGASPGSSFKSRIPIPEDFKMLIRKLLKRNPVERMGFEEFFIQNIVVQARQMDPRLLEPPKLNQARTNSPPGLLDTSRSPESSKLSASTNSSRSPQHSEVKQTSQGAEYESLQDALTDALGDALPAPFPSYGHDPNWSQKVFDKKPLQSAAPSTITTQSSPIKAVTVNEFKFEAKAPVLLPSAKKATHSSQSSFGSSIESIEFSSDEEQKGKDATPRQTSGTPRPHPNSLDMNISDDFVVVEAAPVEIKWHPESLMTKPTAEPLDVQIPTSSPSNQQTWSRPFNVIQNIGKALSSSLLYGSPASRGTGSQKSGSPSSFENKSVMQPPKGRQEYITLGRLFGSLRVDNSFIQNQNSSSSSPVYLDQTILLDALPFKLDVSTLLPSNKSTIQQISLYIARAYSISSLADQFWTDLESFSGDLLQKQTLSQETLHLFIFSIGLYQFAMMQAKELWKTGPSITQAGYSFSSSPHDTQQLYLAHLSTLISFIQTQFDMYLDRADLIPSNDHLVFKVAHRLVFETALSTCKRGALAELSRDGASATGFYKTAVLLLQALLQPGWDPEDVDDRLGPEDVRDVSTLMDQIIVRMARVLM
jgi:hypothetical protein